MTDFGSLPFADYADHDSDRLPYEGDPDMCMCGALISEHGPTENHGPVSEVDYLARDHGGAS